MFWTKTAILATWSTMLFGCTAPEPGVEVRIQRVPVEVQVACLEPEDAPTVIEHTDRATLAGQDLEQGLITTLQIIQLWEQFGGEAVSIFGRCSEIPEG